MKIGLCYRDHIHETHITEIINHIDFLELMPDITNFKETKFLIDLCSKNQVAIGIHCLKSSLGSKEGLFLPSIEQYAIYNEFVESLYFSDHAALTHIQGKYLSSVYPIDFSIESAEIIANNIEILSSYFQNYIMVENITQNTLSDTNKISEGQFFKKIMELTNPKTKVMFDVTNAYVTALNNNFTFEEYLNDFPFEDIMCVHVSGYEKDEAGILHDTHSQALNTHILNATKYILDKSNPDLLLLERDLNVTTLADTLDDIEKLRELDCKD